MIELDKQYCIKVDAYNYILQKHKVTKAGQDAYVSVGYYNDIIRALQAYYREKVKDKLSNAHMSLSEACNAISEVGKEVKDIIEKAIPTIKVVNK